MKAVRIHEDGGPEVLRYEDVPDPEPGDGRGADPPRGGVAQPSRCVGAHGTPFRAEAAHPGCGRRRRGRGARRRRRRVRDRRSRRDQSRASSTAHTIAVVGEHSDGTHCELIAIAAGAGVPARRRAVVRAGRGLPVGLRDGLPDARHEGGRAAGRMGADLGHRRRRRDGGVRDLPRAGRPYHRHLRQRREARAGALLGRRRRDQPPQRRRRRSRQGGDRQRRGRRRRDGRRGDVGAVAGGGRARRTRDRVRSDEWARTLRRRSTGSGGSS